MQVISPQEHKLKVPIKMWTEGVPVADNAIEQLKNIARLPFIFKHVAVMPDCHWGMGSTVGSVIPTRKAVIPAAIGVDIGCGMATFDTGFQREELRGSEAQLRSEIEVAVPHGRSTERGVYHVNDSKEFDRGFIQIGLSLLILEHGP